MLRVGSVPYLVARPVDELLDREPGIELVREVPAKLVEGLRSERLDVALVSSVELFQRPGYSYIDGPAILGAGHVSSVQLFLRKPAEEVRSVALDPASRASVALVRALFGERGWTPRFDELALGEDPREAGTDAWLRIGDAALRETFAPDAPPTFNPSAEWHARTGLPFVFALWIARPGVDLAPFSAAFERAYQHGTARIPDLADEASERWQLAPQVTRRYLAEECSYRTPAGLVPSLEAFRKLLLDHDLADPDGIPTPVACPPGDAPHPKGTPQADDAS